MFDAVYEYFFGSALGMWELAGTVLLIINVYLLAKQKLLNYWFGLVGVLIFGYIFYAYQLYSDMLLQWVFYAPLQILGYYVWKYGNTVGQSLEARPEDSMKVVMINVYGWLVVVIAIVISAGMLGVWMTANTVASFPYADALTTTMSVVASILMLRKIWANWVIWIAMDVIAIPIYYMKGLYITSGLYVVFLGLATYGAIAWYQDYKAQGGNDYRRKPAPYGGGYDV